MARTRVLGIVLLTLLFLLLPGLLEPARGAERLDKKKIQAFAKRFFQARPWTFFDKWDRAEREALMEEAKAFGPIPEGSLEDVVAILMKAAKKAVPKFRGEEFPTPYEGKDAEWAREGKGGKKSRLLIALHGGGENAGNMSEAAGSWSMPKALELSPQGIYLVHDTWNTVHGERFILTLIEHAKVKDEIDPDQVYVAGFSMGGTGSWHMVGRHPDLFAGAIPAHGVIMAEPVSQALKADIKRLQWGLVPNVRNTAVYFYTGTEDKNCWPGTFEIAADQIAELKEADPGGYEKIRFTLHEGIAHTQPPGEPGKAMKFVLSHVRDTFPETLVWQYIASPDPLPLPDEKVKRFQKEWFYWLHCQSPQDQMEARAVRKGNEIDLEYAGLGFVDDFTIYLNPEMIDVKEDVVLRVDGEEVYRGKPQPTFLTVLESLDARMDRRMVFDRKIEVPEPE